MNESKTQPILEVLVKKVYGNERFYPASEDSKLICKLMKVTTFTKQQLRMCQNSGWRVMIKTEEYDLEKD
jgi:hypothetical protein